MSEHNGRIQKIRNLITSFLVVAAIAAGTVTVGPEALDVEEISVAAFNIQVFGQTKRSKPEVMEVLVDVAQEFDVLVVQEVRDSSEMTADIFLEELNAEADFAYAMYEGPRLGRSSSKEQYVIYYKAALIELLHAYIFPDDHDIFEREPLVATLKSGNFDFTVVVCHVKPDDAENELHALGGVVSDVLDANPDEGDIILMGDFNADGTYFDETELPLVFPPDEYHILITNEVDTMTTSDNTYDRMIIMEATFAHEYVVDSAEVFRLDLEPVALDEDFAKKVSDHYPIFAKFLVTASDDDGP